MTTSVMPRQPTTPPGDPLRIVDIRADLLPDEVVAGRRARLARRWVLIGLVALLAATAGGYALTVMQSAVARDELTSARDEAAALTRQQRQFADLLDTQAQSRLLNDELARLFADDVRLPEVLAGMRTAAPSGVRLTGLSVDVTGRAPEEADPSAAGTRLPSTADAELIGTVEINGVGQTKPQIAAYVDALTRLDGVADPYLESAIDNESGFLFTVRLDLTADALGGRYTDTGGN